ncbi:MAG TPA: metallophosphoesterase [Caulobacteraceae bacterium]|nr:metallophosphoesterase [Caulobacteraceae bacterium]
MARLLAGVAIALAVALAGPALAVQTAWDNVAKVVVFGDLHGDYAKFHDMLSQAGLIDAHDNWSGGKTHLVQVGDVPDRAPDTRKIVDLLIKLEPQARRAGGYVHALIGDHEAMNMEGDLRYTTPGEFAAFAGRDSAAIRDRYYAAVVAALKAHPPPTGRVTFDAAFRAKFDAAHPLGWVEHQIAWSTQGPYGRWVLTHPAIIRIDDALYMHGGLGPDFVPFDIEAMNKAVITALNHQPEVAGGPHDILWNEQGPLWYRGLAWNKEASEAANVDAILARYRVSHIVIGHTKAYREVNTRFGGKVILTDVFAGSRCLDPHAFLIKEGDKLTTVYRGHALALGVGGQAQADYLAKVAAVDKTDTPSNAPCGNVEYAMPQPPPG